MSRRIWVWIILVVTLWLAAALPASAGGAALVTLDEMPAEIHAGSPLHLTFTVHQHGVRLVDEFEGVGPVLPYLEARHLESGELLRVDGYKPDGAEVGHFAVDVTFPVEGAWEWQIHPAPFALMNEFPPLMVGPALASAPAGSPLAAISAARASGDLLPWAGGVVLAIAAGALLAVRRQQRAAPSLTAPQR